MEVLNEFCYDLRENGRPKHRPLPTWSEIKPGHGEIFVGQHKKHHFGRYQNDHPRHKKFFPCHFFMSPFCNHFGLFCQNFSHFWLKFLLLLLHYWDFFAKLGRQLWRGSQPRRYTFRPSRHFCFNLFFLCFQFFNHFISERNTSEKLLIF